MRASTLRMSRSRKRWRRRRRSASWPSTACSRQWRRSASSRRTPAWDRFTKGKSLTELADSLDALKEYDESLQLREEAYKLANTFQHLDNWSWTHSKAADDADTYEKKKAHLIRVDEMSTRLFKQKPFSRPA